MEYRRGHSSEAIDWCKRCQSYGDDTASRTATIRAIRAMSHYQLGHLGEARSELAQSREIIGNKYKVGLGPGNGKEGYWFDWVVGKILLREADALIEGTPQASPSAPTR